jgi:hypothetical protein
MTTDERWHSAKQLRKVANVVYIINLVILISIFIIKCGNSNHAQQTSTNNEFNSNASIKSTNGANVRQSPSVTSNVIEKVANNDRIFIIDLSSNPDVVNGQNGYWYKIKTETRVEGFIWSVTVQQDE